MSNYTTFENDSQAKRFNYAKQHKIITRSEYIDRKSIEKLHINALSDALNSERVHECCNYIEVGTNERGTNKVRKAFTCGHKFCPICQKAKSLRLFSELSASVDQHPNMRLLLVTLTLKNCSQPELKQSVHHILQAFRTLTRLTEFKKHVKGWYRTLEIILNKDGTCHPHLHLLLSVKRSYFKKRIDGSFEYGIPQDKLILMWQKCLEIDYLPSVDIRAGDKNNDVKCEVLHYAVKSNDLIDLENPQATQERVAVISNALHRVRLFARSGTLKKVKMSKEYLQELKERYDRDIRTYLFDEEKARYKQV
jgi:plasmid rolling circle replication initiator protein Rep